MLCFQGGRHEGMFLCCRMTVRKGEKECTEEEGGACGFQVLGGQSSWNTLPECQLWVEGTRGHAVRGPRYKRVSVDCTTEIKEVLLDGQSVSL